MYLSPKEASTRYGIHVKTLARLADKGVIDCIRVPGSNHRRYLNTSIEKHLGIDKPKTTVLYARVSTSSQKDDLKSQLECLISSYPGCEAISEIASGMNFKRKKLLSLLSRVISGEVGLIVVTHEDRLVRFGFDLIEWLCAQFECRVIVLNDGTMSPHQELMSDFMAIMHCFSSKLHFLRKYEKQIEADSEWTYRTK